MTRFIGHPIDSTTSHLESKKVKHLRLAIWLYFWLLIFEGSLRKWIVPELSTPLLVVRDPIVLYIYLKAWQAGIFPRNQLLIILIPIACLMIIGGFFAAIFNTPEAIVSRLGIVRFTLAILYGIRTNFLHLPLTFVIPKCFRREDLKKHGYWILLIALPMSLLMTFQFASSPSAFINAGAEGGSQIAAIGGRIRPAGTFSFITGPVLFFPTVMAYAIWSLVKKVYHPLLVMSAVLSVVMAALVSGGSRAFVLGVGVVLAVPVFFLVKEPRVFAKRLVVSSLVVLVMVFGLMQIPSFQEGLALTTRRILIAEQIESDRGGVIGRFASGFLVPFVESENTPVFGLGLGLGTNAGSAIATGRVSFLLGAEGEWARVFAESGPFLGLLYILWRSSLFIWLGLFSFSRLSQNYILPLLLFSSAGLGILRGQFGQPTSLGFAVFGSGLCLTACYHSWSKRD